MKKIIGTDKNVDNMSSETITGLMDDVPAANPFYDNVKLFYTVAEFIFLGIFIAVFLVSVFSNAGNLSYSSAEYIVRNFAMKLDESNEQHTEIVYNPDTGSSFSLFGNGMAVCGNSGLSVFSGTGRKTCTVDFDMNSPLLRSSDKYLLVFENGGRRYRIYNKFTQVFSSETEYPVRDACVAADGSYLLITSASDYLSAVEVYNRNFSLRMRVLKNSYVTSACLRDDGSELLIASLDMDAEGSFSASVSLAAAGKNETSDIITFGGEYPYRICRLSDRICIVTDKSCRFYSSGGDFISSYGFGGGVLQSESHSDEGICLVLCDNPLSVDASYSVILLSSEGNKISEITTESSVISVSAYGLCASVLQYGTVTVLSEEGSSSVGISGPGMPLSVMMYGTDSAYICYNSCAYAVGLK